MCNIVPINYLDRVKNRARHLILANLVAENETYRNFYRTEAKKGATIILDNASIELGDDWATPSELVDIYKSLEAPNAFLMCPEEAFDGEETTRKVREFSKEVKGIPLFGTIHGNNFEEVLNCFLNVRNLVHLVGISYRIFCNDIHVAYPDPDTEKSLMRIELLKMLPLEGTNVHLLGISNPCEIYSQAVLHPQIVSADSSIAYIYARDGHPFTNSGAGCPRPILPINFDDGHSSRNDALLVNNITVLDKFAEGRRV
jgi:hypothetical protein